MDAVNENLLDARKNISTLRIMGYHFSSRLTPTLNLCLIHFKNNHMNTDRAHAQEV